MSLQLDIGPEVPDSGEYLTGMCIALAVLTTISTILRVVSKFVVKQSWWWDDLFAILSLPFFLLFLAMTLVWREIGLGIPAAVVASINPVYLMEGARYMYIAVYFFDFAVTLPKLAAIFFYARVFRANNPRLRIHLWILGCASTAWLVSALISNGFQCDPIEKVWNPPLPGRCFDMFAWYLSFAVLSTIIDLYILFLPVPIILTLKTSLKRRLYLLAAFFLAYSVIVLSIGRLISTIQLIPSMQTDLTWNMPAYVRWVCLEMSISLISVNVPNKVALVKRLWSIHGTTITGSSNQTPGSASQSYGIGAKSDNSSSGHRGFERLTSTHNSRVTTGGGHGFTELGGSDEESALELHGIHIKTDIVVVSR